MSSSVYNPKSKWSRANDSNRLKLIRLFLLLSVIVAVSLITIHNSLDVYYKQENDRVMDQAGSLRNTSNELQESAETEAKLKAMPIYANSPPKNNTPSCTKEQSERIAAQMQFPMDLNLDRNKVPEELGQMYKLRCPNPKWLESFYEEEEDIGSDDYFLGISVGCNKGDDAIRTARMGMSSADFDAVQWKNAFQSKAGSFCNHKSPQTKLVHPKRKGEMHCIEPMPSTFSALKNASDTLGLEQKGFVIANVAISSTHGMVQFPRDQAAGFEGDGIHSCNTNCQDVPASSLDGYVEKNIERKVPVNILQIDVEGWDFDVLFGASSVLDRTHYLEFEYHKEGNWAQLHLNDAIRLLDRKGFTCYWAARGGLLWRITECYFDFFNYWHHWSNIGCVHRSQDRLWEKMEKTFERTITLW